MRTHHIFSMALMLGSPVVPSADDFAKQLITAITSNDHVTVRTILATADWRQRAAPTVNVGLGVFVLKQNALASAPLPLAIVALHHAVKTSLFGTVEQRAVSGHIWAMLIRRGLDMNFKLDKGGIIIVGTHRTEIQVGTTAGTLVDTWKKQFSGSPLTLTVLDIVDNKRSAYLTRINLTSSIPERVWRMYARLINSEVSVSCLFVFGGSWCT
jgi:hypothetical protein